jgi:hypothetical protein
MSSWTSLRMLAFGPADILSMIWRRKGGGGEESTQMGRHSGADENSNTSLQMASFVVCVCVCERERERERVRVCVCEESNGAQRKTLARGGLSGFV